MLTSHMFICVKEQIKNNWEFKCKDVCLVIYTSMMEGISSAHSSLKRHEPLSLFHAIVNNATFERYKCLLRPIV